MASNNPSANASYANDYQQQQNLYGMTDQMGGMNLNSDYGGYYPTPTSQAQQGGYGQQQQEYPGGYQPDGVAGSYNNGYPQGAGDYDYTPQGMNNSPR